MQYIPPIEYVYGFIVLYFDDLVQDCSNSSALAVELQQSCTKQSICCGDISSV